MGYGHKPYNRAKLTQEDLVKIVGKKYGKLTVIDYVGEKLVMRKLGGFNHEYFYKCLCECGNTTTLLRKDLLHHSKSCGCLSKKFPWLKPFQKRGEYVSQCNSVCSGENGVEASSK